MFKLQVVLVPPSAQNALLPYGLASSTAESSQLFGVNPLTNSRNPDSTLPYAPSGNASNVVPHHFTTRTRKFLHFTKSANSLLELSTEIVEKCNKMYPYVDEIEILSLQDSQGCDLDPDFLVKDVFTMDNVVRAIVRNELEIEDSSPVSSYRAAKRKRLNNGSVQNSIPNGVLNITKKRPAAFAMRNPSTANNGNIISSNNNNINSVSNNMRVSTPLAHQIYPPPSDGAQVRMDSNNSEDEDEEQGERSFLPPPAQPQSPPIRVSSGIDQTKKIKSMIEDDTVSRSETVDPDKLRKQRLLSGTPVRPTMTPNRVTLTGQRVVSENQPAHLNNAHSDRKPSFSTTRITSGRLSIPEPKISEIEKELKEGPSSPSSVLPPKPDRIPMKRPLQETEVQRTEEEDEEEEESDESEKKVRQFIQRQTSIADNNGSPTKNSPLSEENVHLAELPQTRPSSAQPQFQRKTSLEAKVEHKSASGGNLMDEERLRIDNFSEDEAEGVQEKEHDRQLEGQLGRGTSQSKFNDANFASSAAARDADADDSDNETANDTVVVRDTGSKSSGNHSINREELLKFMEGDYSPTWNKQSSKRKPYTTVLHKDIDNSKPDPRNILPEKMTRNAAKRAAQLLAGREDESSESESEQEIEESSSDDGSSGIEVDASADDSDDRVAVAENNSVKTLNIHPLKEMVVKTDEKNDQHNDSEHSEGTSFGSSSDHEQNDLPAKNDELQAPKIVVHDSNLQKPDSKTPQSTFTSKEPSTQQQEKFSSSTSSFPSATLSRFRTQLLNSDKKLPKSSPSSLPANNSNGEHQWKFASSPTVSSSGREATDPRNIERPKSASAEDSKRLKETLKQADLEAKQKAFNESKRFKEEAEAKKKQQDEEKLRVKQQEAEVQKKKQQEELERLKQQQFKNQQEELERKKREFHEKKKQEELERQRREEENRKREEENRRKEAEAEKKRIEALEKQRQEKLKLKQQEELDKKKQEEEEKRRKEESEKKRQQELEKKRKEELDRKKQQEEMERKKQQEEVEKRKRQEELEKKKQEEELERRRQQEELEKKKQAEVKKKQEELEKKRQEEELQGKRQQEELEKKRQLEELNRKKKQEELEKKRKEKEDQERKRREEVEKKKQEDLEKKRQAEVKKKQEDLEKKKQAEVKKKQEEELQRKKQAELDKKKQQDAKKKAKSAAAKSTISKPATAKSPAVTNGSDKLKELKARFTSPKAYVPTPAKSSQQNNKGSDNEESESSDDESSTEYSSSSSEDEDESSSKKSRRMVVNTPKGSVTSGKQKSSPKKVPAEDDIEAAPQSTQRSNVSSQRSQSETPISRFFHSPGRGQSQSEPKENSSILDGLPKKVRPSLSSLSDLASRGVPEVREKATSLSPAPHVTRASAKIDSDSEEDDSDENDGSDTESEDSDSDSDDSDSGNSGFISAKTAGSALGKKKKGGGGFASLLRDSQRR